MDSVLGACSVEKIQGMVNIREDITPLVMEWKAIDQLKSLSVPLNSLINLQATKEDSPKMILKITYKPGNTEENVVRLTFTNRPTMNNIKEALQTIVARLRTVIRDSPAPADGSGSSTSGTPAPSSTNGPGSALGNGAGSGNGLSTDSLSDAGLLKNHELQQKFLLEDAALRTLFTQSVINFKLLPTIFWSSRLNHLRTYALTISQQRGPYNVLSTIKPVASSDNQVNVNVSRDTINEIFDTYPIIKKAFTDLVPKINEGEFWLRFFNSKLFRRLRGEKINTANDRGDAVLDKYLYIDQDWIQEERRTEAGGGEVPPEKRVNKFIDILGNEDDNSSKQGNRPDFTMRFTEEKPPHFARPSGAENEMIILMKNMNKLSSKMVNMSVEVPESTPIPQEENHYDVDDLNLNDLNEIEDPQFIRLNIDPGLENKKIGPETPTSTPGATTHIDRAALKQFIMSNRFVSSAKGIELTDTYISKKDEIEKTSGEITQLIKQNFRTHKLIMKEYSAGDSVQNLVPDSIIQEIIRYNMTVVEFLSHFWKLFLGGNNPNQLKKLFLGLKNCQNDLNALKERSAAIFGDLELVKTNDRLKDKMVRDFQNCISPMEIGLQKAVEEYGSAIRKAQEKGLNENGKRVAETQVV